MIKRLTILAFFIANTIFLFAQKSITLEDIWKNRTFAAKGVSGFVP